MVYRCLIKLQLNIKRYNYDSFYKGSIAQSVEQETENLRVGGSIPPQGTICGSSSVVECHLAKVDVASPNLVYRSTVRV